jgi:hypothetical protein
MLTVSMVPGIVAPLVARVLELAVKLAASVR